MDIEGSEAMALRGMRGLLERYGYPPIFMEVNAHALLMFQETPMSLLTLANEIGYKAYRLDSNSSLTLYEASQFPMDVCVDVLLMKTIPYEIPFKTVKKAGLHHQEIVDWIYEKISNIEKWTHDDWYSYLYILYVLKDFPGYYKDSRIRDVLVELRDKRMISVLPYYNQPFFPHIIEWIKEI